MQLAKAQAKLLSHLALVDTLICCAGIAAIGFQNNPSKRGSGIRREWRRSCSKVEEHVVGRLRFDPSSPTKSQEHQQNQ
jgi:hypothetical protein